MLVRDQEAGGSNPLAPTKFLKDLQALPLKSGPTQGPFLDPTLTRTLDSVAPCSRVFIDLVADDFDDLLGPDQEV
jgi:hypothetical protein